MKELQHSIVRTDMSFQHYFDLQFCNHGKVQSLSHNFLVCLNEGWFISVVFNVLGVFEEPVGMFLTVKMIGETQVPIIGWKSEMFNVLKWIKWSYTTKNCPASSMSFEHPTEHSCRQIKPVYNFLSLETKAFYMYNKVFSVWL